MAKICLAVTALMFSATLALAEGPDVTDPSMKLQAKATQSYRADRAPVSFFLLALFGLFFTPPNGPSSWGPSTSSPNSGSPTSLF